MNHVYEKFNQSVEAIMTDFRLNVKQDETDEELVSSAGINTDEELTAEQLEMLLNLKEDYSFSDMKMKRSGTGIKIDYKL